MNFLKRHNLFLARILYFMGFVFAILAYKCWQDMQFIPGFFSKMVALSFLSYTSAYWVREKFRMIYFIPPLACYFQFLDEFFLDPFSNNSVETPAFIVITCVVLSYEILTRFAKW